MCVSQFNDCPFCVLVHTETTRIEARREVSVDDPSVLRPELAAVIPLLEKLTKDPESCGPTDVNAAREAGVPDEAIIDALHVGFLFNRSIEWPTRSTGPGNPTSTCGSPRE